ncbi:unnamed protein product, partial [marine sediment metagenome]
LIQKPAKNGSCKTRRQKSIREQVHKAQGHKSIKDLTNKRMAKKNFFARQFDIRNSLFDIQYSVQSSPRKW